MAQTPSRTRQLRHIVRGIMLDYSKSHPEDFEAYMTMSACMFLLAGRPGMSLDQRNANLAKAKTHVAALADKYPTSRRLAVCVAALDEMLSEVGTLAATAAVAAATSEADKAFLADFENDFAAWSAQLGKAE